MIDIHNLTLTAAARIRPHVRQTPLEPSTDLGRESSGPVFLKLENIQHTGSFKVRGAINRLMALDPDQRRAGIVTASSGNHGLAVAFGLKRLGIKGVICLPEGASALKVQLLESLGAEMRFHGST